LEVGVCIAGEDSASGESVFINITLTVDIVWASGGVHGADILGAYFFGQVYQFRGGNEKTMVKAVEITALSADIAFAGAGFLRIYYSLCA
jgi:hypothetical protein